VILFHLTSQKVLQGLQYEIAVGPV